MNDFLELPRVFARRRRNIVIEAAGFWALIAVGARCLLWPPAHAYASNFAEPMMISIIVCAFCAVIGRVVFRKVSRRVVTRWIWRIEAAVPELRERLATAVAGGGSAEMLAAIRGEATDVLHASDWQSVGPQRRRSLIWLLGLCGAFNMVAMSFVEFVPKSPGRTQDDVHLSTTRYSSTASSAEELEPRDSSPSNKRLARAVDPSSVVATSRPSASRQERAVRAYRRALENRGVR